VSICNTLPFDHSVFKTTASYESPAFYIFLQGDSQGITSSAEKARMDFFIAPHDNPTIPTNGKRHGVKKDFLENVRGPGSSFWYPKCLAVSLPVRKSPFGPCFHSHSESTTQCVHPDSFFSRPSIPKQSSQFNSI